MSNKKQETVRESTKPLHLIITGHARTRLQERITLAQGLYDDQIDEMLKSYFSRATLANGTERARLIGLYTSQGEALRDMAVRDFQEDMNKDTCIRAWVYPPENIVFITIKNGEHSYALKTVYNYNRLMKVRHYQGNDLSKLAFRDLGRITPRQVY